MTKRVLVLFIFIQIINFTCAYGSDFNYRNFHHNNSNTFSDLNFIKDTNRTRNGKFLFDSLFGLELEEELINAASQNTLKSCDCGKSLLIVHKMYNMDVVNVNNENESVRKQLSLF
jgi:hypothetical protein